MECSMKIEAFAVPRGLGGADPAVHVSAYFRGFAMHQRLTVEQAEDAHARLGAAIGTIKLAKALTSDSDPRHQERLYRAKLAIRLGLTDHDVCAVFDLHKDEYARLVQEVQP